MTWEYIASTALAANTDLLFMIKGNSITDPGGLTTYGLGVTSDPPGYARMYTQYRLVYHMGSSIKVSAWGVSGAISGGVPTAVSVSVPLRVAIVPAQSTAAIVYFGGNTASIAGYNHSSTAFGNNTVHVASHGNHGMFNTGEGKQFKFDQADGSYSAGSGSDPGITWNYVIGIGNASTALNATTMQARIVVTYKCKFYQPIAQAVQVARDIFGNEKNREKKERKEESKVIGSLPAAAVEDAQSLDDFVLVRRGELPLGSGVPYQKRSVDAKQPKTKAEEKTS
jgi:hypothetical protein